MSNIVNQTFTANTNWTAPAEVFNVKVIGTQTWMPFAPYGISAAMIATDGQMYAWGDNATGELGLGDVTLRSSPVAVLNSYVLDFVQFTQASMQAQGSSCALALNAAGDCYAWGYNGNGNLGVGDVASRSSPVAVLGGIKFASVGIMQIVQQTSFGLTQAGVAYMWGINTNGQIGDGTVIPKSSPVAVLGGLTFTQLVPSVNAQIKSSIVGLTTAGAAYAWGSNTFGNLGVGDVTDRSSPVAVLGGLTFVKIFGNIAQSSISGLSFYGLTAAGALYAWGDNHDGQLGVGDQIPRSSPVLVLGGLTWKTISTAANSVIGITTGGVAYAWGINVGSISGGGQLGVGDTNSRSSPVAVLGGLTWQSIQLSVTSSFGLTAAGVLYAWGYNAGYWLGVGDNVSRSSPVAVLGGLTWQSIYPNVFEQITYGITTTGQVYSWGTNLFGNAGQGPVAGSSSPVLILTGKYVSPQSNQIIKEIQVVPGTTYAINILNPICFFGSTPIGPMLTQVTLQYQQ